MELWLIRHALPVREERSTGSADPGLAPGGHEQARRLSDWWAPFGADVLVSSPMRRALETARPLSHALGLEPEVVDDIAEYDAHLPTYVPVEELQEDPEAFERIARDWLSPEAEEARQAFRTRVVDAIDAAVDRHPDARRMAIVCHGGVINAYLTTTLFLPGTMMFEPFYTSVSRVLRKDGARQFVTANETPHLTAPPLPSVSI